MPRIFVALDLPEQARMALSLIQSGVAGARWVPAENFHVTLCFLGELTHPAVDDLIEIASSIEGSRFCLRLSGVGYFASRDRARSIWAGVESDRALLALQARLSRALITAGLARRERRYRPHVTLARFSGLPVDRLRSFLQYQAGFRAAPFAVERFTIFESLTGRRGAVYRPVHQIAFAPP